jgi:multimeric flavodoxin WrbA
MDKNILIVIGSHGDQHSKSNAISNNLVHQLINKNINCSKLYLKKMINEKNTIVDNIDKSDVIILISPIYENTAPSAVIKFFEIINENKNKLAIKNRKMFVIANSGFPKIEASKSLITTCNLFARAMNFKWLGGIAVAPGTLIDGEVLGKSYKKLILALNFIAEDIYNDEEISKEVFRLTSKPFISPIIYLLAGRIIQKRPIKNIGRDNYYAKPLRI